MTACAGTGEQHDDENAERYPAAGEVRRAQAGAERLIAAARMVSTTGISKLDDRRHYDTEGRIELGRRFARAYLELAGHADDVRHGPSGGRE
jgi:hypothetical protein